MNPSRPTTSGPAFWQLGLPLLFFGLFYFHPVMSILTLGLSGVADDPRVVRMLSRDLFPVLSFTLWQAALSAFLTLVFALPAAWLVGRFHFRGKALFQAVVGIPFVLPTVVVATAFLALFEPGGLFSRMFGRRLFLEPGLVLVLFAHVFFNFSVVVRIVGGFWGKIPPDLEDGAQLLGATPKRRFLRITLPLLFPALLSAFCLVFVFCFSSFGVILILGGPTMRTLEVDIYQRAVLLFQLPPAALLSAIQIGVMLLVMTVQSRLQRRAAVRFSGKGSGERKPLTMTGRLVCAISLGFVVLPLMGLVVASFDLGDRFGLLGYRALFSTRDDTLFSISPLLAIWNSLRFGGWTLLFSLALGIPAARYLALGNSRITRMADPVLMLPMATSAVTLGFGFILALDWPIDLRTSLFLVPLAHTLVAFPFVIRVLVPAYRSLPTGYMEAAALLGATPFRAWLRVEAPLLARPVLAAGIFSVAISFGEFGASIFTARPGFSTMPVAIYRYLGQPGVLNRAQAMAMATVLMGVITLLYISLEALVGRRGEREI